jgi:hypothetical protein
VLFSLAFLFTNKVKAAVFEVGQINPQQISKNSSINIVPTLSSGEATWSKIIGPDWISVDSSSGVITGIANNVGEAHYVQIKAVNEGSFDVMTFILVIGDQDIFWMDGQNGNPESIQAAYSVMNSGDVLIIPDGAYLGTENTINGSTGECVVKNGTIDNYTTVISEHPNEVSLPRAYHKGGQYIAYKGLEFETGMTIDGDLRFGINSNHIKVMMSSAKSGGFEASYGASYVLFEDCFAYGNSRSVFRVGSTGNESHHIIFRRCVARHDLYTGIEPTASFMHYGGNNILFQNCIDIDQSPASAFPSANGRYGSWETKNGQYIYIKDSIALNTLDMFHYGDSYASDVYFSNSVFWDVGTGSTALSAITVYDNITIGNVDAQNTENTFTDRSSSTSVYFSDSIFYDIEGTGTESGYRSKTILYDVPESFNNLFYPIQSDLTIGDITDTITGINPVSGTPGNGIAGIVYPIQIEPGSDADSNGVGATIQLRRGVSGSLWGESGYDDIISDSLWPWPNEDQIKSKMAAYNYNSGGIAVNGNRGFAASGDGLYGGSITLTSYIWEYLGNTCPENICSRAVVLAESCTDNIQNQDETGIDCGGVCDACIIPTTYTLTNFISVITNWLQIGNETSDVNSDGVVNTRDLGVMMSEWE